MKHRREALQCQSWSSLLHNEMSVCLCHLQLPAHPATRTSSASAVVSCWLSQSSLGRAQSGQSLVYRDTDLLGATIATGGQLGILLCYSFMASQDAAASVATFTHLQCLPLPQYTLQGGPLIAINGCWVSRKFHIQWARTKHEICLVVYVAETANFSKARRQIMPFLAVTTKSKSETKP